MRLVYSPHFLLQDILLLLGHCTSSHIASSISFVWPQGHIICASSSSSRLLVYLFVLSGRSRSPARNRSPGHEFTFSFQSFFLEGVTVIGHRGAGCTHVMHGRSRMTIGPRIPMHYAGTEHAGISPTRQTLLARSAGRRQAFGESHEG